MLNALLLLTVAGGLLPLAARWWWVLELTSHFRLQYLAVGLVLLITGIAARRPRLAMAVAITMVVNALPLLPYLPIAVTSAPVAAEEQLTILNVNVNAGNRDHAAILRAIRDSGADIVVLVELSHALEASLDSIAEAYPFRLTVPTTDNFGIGLLSRQLLENRETFLLGPTQALSATIESGGRELTLMAAHPLPPRSGAMAATRNRQLALLAERISRVAPPLIVCGDFNLSPYSPYFTEFEQRAGVASARRGLGIGISWPASLPVLGTAIDHCFVRGELRPRAIERLDRIGSDHYPVRVRLSLS